MPEIFATRCGSIDSSKQASMIAAVIEFVPATRAQGRDRALVVAVGIAEFVLRQFRVMEFRLGDIGHAPNVAVRSGLGQPRGRFRIAPHRERERRPEKQPETALVQEFVQLRHQSEDAENQEQETGRALRPPRPLG